jgi:AcrR family transcriptional regulator
MSALTLPSARSRLLVSGAELMADKGFDGVSVREVCTHAGTSINMVHHYFGSKQGLLDAIVDQFSSGVFALPMLLLDKEPQSKAEFQSIIELLFESTLDAFIEHRSVMLVVVREQADPEALPTYMERVATFLERAKTNGFVRSQVNTGLIAGFFLDRILNQVQFAPWINRNYGADLLSNAEYKQQWCRANVDVLLNGIMP